VLLTQLLGLRHDLLLLLLLLLTIAGIDPTCDWIGLLFFHAQLG
jgi:hypothetical protein